MLPLPKGPVRRMPIANCIRGLSLHPPGLEREQRLHWIDFLQGRLNTSSRVPPEAMPDETPGCVLLVEDEPIVRFPIAEALRDLGVQVVEASTADEAWDHLESGSMVDVVFT